MIAGVAIDAGWLVELDGMDFDDLALATAVVGEMGRLNVPLVLDYEDRIRAEYDRHLVSGSLGRKLFTSRQSQGLVTYLSGRATNACLAALRSARFDEDDLPYVGVSQACGHGFYLTHESKHRSEPFVSILREACGVLVGTLADLSALL